MGLDEHSTDNNETQTATFFKEGMAGKRWIQNLIKF